MTPITIRKLDHAGRQVLAYSGQVLRRDGTAIVLRTSWGRGPLGNGSTSNSSVPVPVNAPTGWMGVDARWSEICALGWDGKVYCWAGPL